MRRPWLLPALAFLLGLPACVVAAPIRISGSGLVATAPPGDQAADIIGVPNGTRWAIDAFIDEGVSDSNPNVGKGDYFGLTGTISMGAETVSIGQFPTSFVSVTNAGNASGPFDGISVVLRNTVDSDPLIAGNTVVLFAFTLQSDFRNDLIGSDDLSEVFAIDFPSLGTCLDGRGFCAIAGAPVFTFQIFTPGKGFLQLIGSVDSYSAVVVPLPAAAWLFASALGGLAWLRRHARVAYGTE